MIQAITTAGLTSNLQLCLDAGDPLSYTSGQSWLDRSGNGYDFFLGADGSGTATDPTFVSAGRLSYWTFDGGDYFTYDTTNETWMQNLHKNNAVFSYLCMFYKPGAVSAYAFGDTGAGSVTGALVNVSSSGLEVVNAGVGVIGKSGTSAGVGWHFSAGSITEATGAGGGFFYRDGSYDQSGGSDTFDSTYTLPSSGSASHTFQIAASGNGSSPFGVDTRMSCIAIWSSALSKGNMDALWTSMRGRFLI